MKYKLPILVQLRLMEIKLQNKLIKKLLNSNPWKGEKLKIKTYDEIMGGEK